jgi:hypothetical protein
MKNSAFTKRFPYDSFQIQPEPLEPGDASLITPCHPTFHVSVEVLECRQQKTMTNPYVAIHKTCSRPPRRHFGPAMHVLAFQVTPIEPEIELQVFSLFAYQTCS